MSEEAISEEVINEEDISEEVINEEVISKKKDIFDDILWLISCCFSIIFCMLLLVESLKWSISK